MASKLEQLRGMTVVVADTGDIEAVRRLKPQDRTTNPTLLLKAVENPAYSHLVEEAVAWGRGKGGGPDAVAAAVCDRLAVSFGTELAKIVPGRVSTEVDADLAFDTRATVDKARGARRHPRLHSDLSYPLQPFSASSNPSNNRPALVPARVSSRCG